MKRFLEFIFGSKPQPAEDPLTREQFYSEMVGKFASENDELRRKLATRDEDVTLMHRQMEYLKCSQKDTATWSRQLGEYAAACAGLQNQVDALKKRLAERTA